MKKYHRIIQELETIADIQLQIQTIIKLADVANNWFTDIETILLQIGETYKMQIGRNIYSISEELRYVIYGNMEWQAHYIQVLLANELDQCKGKEIEAVDKHIKVL